MRKKHRRDVRFLRISLTQKIKHSRDVLRKFQNNVNGHTPLEECLLQLQVKQNENPSLLSCLRSNGTIRRAIRRLSFDNRLVTILFGVGDKNAADPSFWNDNTDEVRNEKAEIDERLGCTGHMVVCLDYMPQLDGYIACLEETPQLGPGSIEDTLKDIFSKHVVIQQKNEEASQKTYTLTIDIKIDILASRDFEEAMSGREPIAIVAETVEDDKGFDENFIRKERLSCTLKAQKGTPWKQFLNAISALRGENKKYKRYIIKYKESNIKERGSIAINQEDLDHYDLDSCLLSQRDRIPLEHEIAQFCHEIHSELEEKMKRALFAEQRRMTGKTDGATPA